MNAHRLHLLAGVSTSLLAVMVARAAPSPAAAKPNQDKDGFQLSLFELYFPPHDTQTILAEGLKKADEKVDKILGIGPAQNLTLDQLRELGRAVDYATLKTLVERGEINPARSKVLGDLRLALALEAVATTAHRQGRVVYVKTDVMRDRGLLSTARLSLFVYKEDGAGGRVRDVDGERTVREVLAQEFKRLNDGVPMERLGIRVNEPGGRFPQPWEHRVSVQPFSGAEQEGVRDHKTAFEVLLEKQAELKKSKGTIYSQAQENFDRLRTEQEIANRLGTGRPQDLHPELRKRSPHSGDLLCLRAAPAAGVPVTKPVSGTEAAKVLVDRVPPVLLKGHAFDLAVSSLLRVNGDPQALLNPARRPPVEDLFKALEGLRLVNTDATRPQTRYQLGGFLAFESQRAQLLDTLNSQLRGMRVTSEAQLRHIQLTMDISRKILAAGPTPDVEFLRGVFEPLARELAGPDGKWQDQLRPARERYHQCVQEIMHAAVYGTLKTGLMGYLAYDANDLNRNPAERLKQFIDEPLLRRAMGLEDPKHDRVWKSAWPKLAHNYGASFALAVLNGMSAMQSDPRFLKALDAVVASSGLNPVEKERVRGMLVQSREAVYGPGPSDDSIWRRTYDALSDRLVRRPLSAMGDFLREYTLMQLGLEDLNRVLANDSVAGVKGWDTYRTVLGEMWARKMAITGRLALQMLPSPVKPPVDGVPADDSRTRRLTRYIDWGGVDSMLQIARAYSESGGSWEAALKKTGEEALEGVPIIGQIYTVLGSASVEEAGVRTAMIYLCIKCPHAAAAALAWSIGDASIDLYFYEYSRPFATEVADALYRGYVGPPPHQERVMPPAFTKKDADELAQLTTSVSDLLKKTGPTKAELESGARAVTRRNELEIKRSKWAAYQDSARGKTHEGGAIFGKGGRTKFEELAVAANPELPDIPTAMAGPLLARVKPVVVFLEGGGEADAGPGAVVDFGTQPLSAEEKQSLESMAKELESRPDYARQFDLTWDIGQLQARQARWEFAQKVLREAEADAVLRHQIQRDSLWPHMLRDTTGDLVNPDRFVRDWIALHRRQIPPALQSLGIGDGQTMPEDPLRFVGPIFDSLYDIVKDDGMHRGYTDEMRLYIREMIARLRVDTERSKQNWNAYQAIKALGPELARRERDKAKRALLDAVVVEAARTPPSLLADSDLAMLRAAGYRGPSKLPMEFLSQAVEQRHLPALPVGLEFDLRVVEDATGTPAPKRIHASLEISADPSVYKPPYFSALFQLSPDMVLDAVKSGAHKGIPLSAEQRSSLDAYLKAQPPDTAAASAASGEKAVTPAIVMFGFCSGYAAETRVVPETTAGLPTPVSCRLEGRAGEAWLLGGAAFKPRVVRESALVKTPVARLTAETGFSVRELYVDVPNPSEPPPQNHEWKILRSRAPDGPWISVLNKDLCPGTVGGPVEWRYIAVARPYAGGRNRIGILSEDELAAAVPAVVAADLRLPKPEFVFTPTNRWDEGFIRWKQPELAPPLDGMRDQIQVDAYFAVNEGGPYVRYLYGPHRPSLEHDDYTDPPPEPRLRPLSFSHSGSPLFHGMKGFMKARLVLGGLSSAWVARPVTQPPWEGSLNVGRGQTIWIKPSTNTATVVSTEKGYCNQDNAPSDFIATHGAAGMDEEGFKRLTEKSRQDITAEFWTNSKESTTPRAELEQALAEDIKGWEESFFDYRKARAPLPSAPLGSVIGLFTPATVLGMKDPPWHYIGPGATNDKEPVRLWLPDGAFYFAVGAGTSFKVPEDGRVSFIFNWDHIDRNLIADYRLEVNSGFVSLADGADPSRLTGPVWGPGQIAGWSYRRATVSSTAAQPPFEWLSFCRGSSPDGPWEYEIPGEKPQTGADLRIGDAPVYFRALRHRYGGFTNADGGTLWLTGLEWSEPLKVVREDRTETLTAATPVAVSGRRGQTVTVTVAGLWNPFRFADTKPYGPEGMSDDEFAAGVALVQEQSKQAGSTGGGEGGLLGVAMGVPAGAEAATVTDYRYDEFALERKGMFHHASLPVGCVFALARVGGGQYGPFPVSKSWTFTFPEDGYVSFQANTFDSWVNEKPYIGDKALTLTFSIAPAAAQATGE